MQPMIDTSVPPQAGTPIKCRASDEFPAWIAASGGSIALTTYQAGKVALIGFDPRTSQVTLLMRQFDKPMGLAVHGSKLALATRHELLLLADAPLLAPDYLEQSPGKYDTLYLPRASYHTGDLSMHDVAFGTSGTTGTSGMTDTSDATDTSGATHTSAAKDSSGAPGAPEAPDDIWFVNTRFSCLCRVSDDFSFVPQWKPKFVSDLTPEDRCHLNGLAMRHGKPAHVTALGTTDEAGKWREHKATGGVLIDVNTNDTVLTGLCMPHSPRWFKTDTDPEKLYFLNSGQGELCVMDEADVSAAKYTVVCALPGYTRGLSFATSPLTSRVYALVGLSQVRATHLFDGLPVQKRWNNKLQAGVCVVDLLSGKHIATFEFTEGCTELYDVQFLPCVRRPTILNLEKDRARQAITSPEFSYWIRPKEEGKA